MRVEARTTDVAVSVQSLNYNNGVSGLYIYLELFIPVVYAYLELSTPVVYIYIFGVVYSSGLYISML